MDGWIKLHRSILDWEWYSDTNTMRLFVHFLLKANFTAKKWKGVDIQPGGLITSLSHLKQETGLSIQQIRTSLNRLKSTQEITQYQHSQFTHIQINNYNKYQTLTQSVTSEQQASNKRATSEQQQRNTDNTDNTDEELKNTKKHTDLTAYQFLFENTPIQLEQLWMKNSKFIAQKDFIIETFNDKAVLEGIPFEEKKLIARLSMLMRNWKNETSTTGLKPIMQLTENEIMGMSFQKMQEYGQAGIDEIQALKREIYKRNGYN